MKIDEIFRYGRPYSDTPDVIDGLPNFFFVTALPGSKKTLLDAGINSPAILRAQDGDRVPAIMIRSSAHKAGSEDTPWQDLFRPDFGHIRYFGDNKSPGKSPEHAAGNALLLSQFKLHHSTIREERLHACPILAFRAVSIDDRIKGQVQFQGVCLIERIERVVQIEPKSNLPFVNYCFDLLVINLLKENEDLNWKWINDRRDPKLTAKETLRFAPESWKNWIESGRSISNQIRRSVIKKQIISTKSQKPMPGSREEKTLKEIYAYYGAEKRKARFEAVAAFVASRILSNQGGTYRPGWITQASSDNGIDFVGRLDIGSEFATTKLIVLGQAKCEKLDSPTNGNDIARTVARLRRGWIGIYVTTSYFSDKTQLEVLEDQYPIIMVDGLRLAKEINATMIEQGLTNANQLLDLIDSTYEDLLAKRSPEEVLLI